MNTPNGERLSVGTYSSQVLIATENSLFRWIPAVRIRLIISLWCSVDTKAFSHTELLNSVALCMWGRVCGDYIDLEANHRVSKRLSQNITLKPFRGLPALLLVLYQYYFFLCEAFHKHADPHFLWINPTHTSISWNCSWGQLESLWSSLLFFFFFLLRFIVLFFLWRRNIGNVCHILVAAGWDPSLYYREITVCKSGEFTGIHFNRHNSQL